MTKKIIVTGASSGIGRSAAVELAKSGHALALVARREDALREVAEECGNATIHPFDLNDVDAIPGLIEGIRSPGVYPVLINSAGIGIFGPFGELGWEDVERQNRLNLLAPMKLIHSVLPWMRETGGGQIVNVLSMVADQVLAGCSAYAASKAGLLMLGKTLAAEYRTQGVKVTNLLPGAVDTPIWDAAGGPPREEMIPVQVVADAIADLVNRPANHNVDQLTIMPTKGVL